MYSTTYHRPSSVDEAAALFAKGSDAKYLAGGHTLLPVMKQRLASPSDVIDLARIPALVSERVRAGLVGQNGGTYCRREGAPAASACRRAVQNVILSGHSTDRK